MTEIDYLNQLAAAAIHEEMDAQRRAGKDGGGHWCVSCGHVTSDLALCRCAFPESFRCAGGKALCGACQKAHKAVAAHLETMFSAKRLVVHRADSRRCRLFRFLRDALEVLADKGNAQAKSLRSLLGGHADPRADEFAEFRASVLDAFRRSAFADFQALAKQLDEEETLYCLTKLTYSGILGR